MAAPNTARSTMPTSLRRFISLMVLRIVLYLLGQRQAQSLGVGQLARRTGHLRGCNTRRSSSRRISDMSRYRDTRCSGEHAALIRPAPRRPRRSVSRCRRRDDAIDAGRRHTEVALGLQ